MSYIKIDRGIEEWKFYFSEPFTMSSAWIDLILLARYEDGTINIRGNIVKVKRGQVALSEDFLANRWHWSRGKVRRFFSRLKTAQQMTIETVQHNKLLVGLKTIVNYDKFQSCDTTELDNSSTADSTTDSTTDGTVLRRERRERKEKIIKKNFEPPTIGDIENFISESGFKTSPEKFHAYYESNGWMMGKYSMKNWKASIRTWELRDFPKQKKQTPEERARAVLDGFIQ